MKRLATSVVLAGREAGADEDDCRKAARDVAGSYRRTMRLLAKLPVVEAWKAIADEELVSHTDARDLLGTLEQVAEKARRNTSARFAAKATEPTADGGRRFVDAQPVLRRVPDAEAAAVAAALSGYLDTVTEHRLPCWPVTRSTMWPSAWSARAAWGCGRMWCCCWITAANRWSCR